MLVAPRYASLKFKLQLAAGLRPAHIELLAEFPLAAANDAVLSQVVFAG